MATSTATTSSVTVRGNTNVTVPVIVRRSQ
jgi:hypothetical protein